MQTGFKKLEDRALPALRGIGRLYRHACGLEVLSVECDDVENMFSAAFLTIPVDDTGVTHIIEHSVLGGSKHYPVRDPFMEMYKSSVATFLNALTYHDYTIYPVSSAVQKDFFNLASVYFDAVFNPLLSPSTFAQEGWHFDFKTPGSIRSKLVCNGVVLNEMTGAFADMDEKVLFETNRNLFPESSRRFYSGGLPTAIPRLSYRRFKNYYKTHYHPSVAKLFFYGNIPTEEKLAFLEERLAELEFSPIRPAPPPPVQPFWNAPIRKTIHYTPVMDEHNGCSLAISTYLSNSCNPVLDLAFDFLDNLLLDNESSPLHKRMMESGLCERLGLSGFDNETLESSFIIVAHGVEKRNLQKMERIIQESLRECASQGFSNEHLAAAFAQFKLEQSEITSSFVYTQMEKVYDAWFYGQDPFLYLDYSDTIAKLEHNMADKKWLPAIIQKYLCDNPHKLTLTFIPDTLTEKRQEARTEARLDGIKAKLDTPRLEKIAALAESFRNGQIANFPEALATLPTLSLHDIPQKPYIIPRNSTSLANDIRLVEVEQFTNGVAYFNLAFPLDSLTPLQLQHLLPDFISLFTKTGTRRHSYDQMAERLAGCGGSISPFPMLWTDLDTGTIPHAGLRIELRALEEHFPKLLEILYEYLHETVLTETEFIQRRMKQLWSSARDGIMNHGASLLLARTSAGLTPTSILGEKWSGFSALETQRRNTQLFRRTWPQTQAILEGILGKLATARPSLATFNGSPKARQATLDFLSSLNGKAGLFQLDTKKLPKIDLSNGRSEKLIVSSDVSTCVRTFKAPSFHNPLSIPLNVYATLLDNGFAWDELRNNGGAYSASISYKAQLNIFSFSTAQDPSPTRSFQIFDDIPNMKLTLNGRELTNAILSTIKSNLSPVRPDGASMHAFSCEIYNISDEMLIERYQKYMSLTPEDLIEATRRFWETTPEFNNGSMGPASKMRKLDGKTIRY